MDDIWTLCKEYLSFPNYYINDHPYWIWINNAYQWGLFLITNASSDSFQISDKLVTKNIAILKSIVGLHPLTFRGEICPTCYTFSTCWEPDTRTCSWLTNVHWQPGHCQHLWFTRSPNNKSQLNDKHIKQSFKCISTALPAQDIKQFVHQQAKNLERPLFSALSFFQLWLLYSCLNALFCSHHNMWLIYPH